jgi:Bacteriophage lambda head decoration protein D
MRTIVESLDPGEFLVTQAGAVSRDVVTIAASQPTLNAGTLLGKVTATGKHIAYSASNSDGSETCVGILFAVSRPTGGDRKVLMIARNAEASASLITGLDDAAAIALNAHSIVFR